MSTTREPGEITQILRGFTRGDMQEGDRLMRLVYRELRKIAARHFRQEPTANSLQPTILVHEAYLRLIDITRVDWQDRTHFFSLASILMRRILVEHYRAKIAHKRGGTREHVLLDETQIPGPAESPDILALDEALQRLALLDPRQAKVVEMRFFGGMTEEETGEILGVSTRTVKRDWQTAKAWLYKELSCT